MIWGWCICKNSNYVKWVATSEANKQHSPFPKCTAKPHCYKMLQNTVTDKNQIGSTHLPTRKYTWTAAMLGKRQTDCKENKMFKTQIQLFSTVENPHKLPQVHTENFLCFYWMLEIPNEMQIWRMRVFMLSSTTMLQGVIILLCITQMPTSALFLQKSNFKNPNTKNFRQITQSLTRYTDMQESCKRNRPLWILPSILLPPFSPQFSQGGRLLWIVTLPAEQQHCRRWLSLGFPQDKTLEMLGAQGRNAAFLFSHFTFLCPYTANFLLSPCLSGVRLRHSLTQNFLCAGSVCFPWDATLHRFIHPKGTTPDQLSHSAVLAALARLVVSDSQGQAILALLNEQVHLLQALFIQCPLPHTTKSPSNCFRCLQAPGLSCIVLKAWQ